jgi:hypothetical protein
MIAANSEYTSTHENKFADDHLVRGCKKVLDKKGASKRMQTMSTSSNELLDYTRLQQTPQHSMLTLLYHPFCPSPGILLYAIVLPGAV